MKSLPSARKPVYTTWCDKYIFAYDGRHCYNSVMVTVAFTSSDVMNELLKKRVVKAHFPYVSMYGIFLLCLRESICCLSWTCQGKSVGQVSFASFTDIYLPTSQDGGGTDMRFISCSGVT